MARPLRVEYEGAFYHVTSRGNEGKEIFSSNEDRIKLMSYFESAYKRFNIKIHSYCLMENHYHILAETPGGNLSRSMQYINSSYTTYYNTKHERKGHLFQGRYKAIIIDKDSYMQELTRYIHLNPVRAGIVKRPEDYRWSSYMYFVSSKKPSKYIETKLTLSYFNMRKKLYKNFIEDGILEKAEDPLKNIEAGLILGDKGFVEKIKSKYLDDAKKTRDLPSLRKLKREKIIAEDIISLVQKEKKLTEREKTKIMVYLMRKYTGETLEEISERLSCKVSGSAISKIITRLEDDKGRNRLLKKRLRAIEHTMSNGEV